MGEGVGMGIWEIWSLVWGGISGGELSVVWG